MKKLLYFLLLLFSVSFISVSCFDDLFGTDTDTEETTSSTSNERASYEFSFTCPAGTKSTVTITKGTEKCQKSQEYFAKMYGCNEADYFNEANCRVCHDCNWKNYCSVCK